eukprot:CAMPEP_0185727126 /NCGR_PEP_ID=MMETSP1171-20130828/2902_1 /TAXON_ID=374046 /ORGANISM="Helicotheca tamensis, Strain CCMP826" /LENGTH=261 /DNA_ID=CAMNT_0028395629 /DNA_START=146 /DNA_END=931 /DNA_ORIENTATION=+
MSNDVTVRGVMTGGFFSGLARAFLTNESFFTTKVEYSGRAGVGEVLIAPSDPGGIVLHTLEGHRENDDLLVTGGAYVASDNTVKITTEVQSRLGNSLLSGTGIFLLRASGRGCLACAAYGSVHKYLLRAGEKRAVDNGHLVAWTASMNYSVGLGGRQGGFISSVSSGEGLMCFFEGPGVIFVQSHKPNTLGGTTPTPSSPRRASTVVGGFVGVIYFLFFFFMFVFSFLIFPIYLSYKDAEENIAYGNNYHHYGGGRGRHEF